MWLGQKMSQCENSSSSSSSESATTLLATLFVFSIQDLISRQRSGHENTELAHDQHFLLPFVNLTSFRPATSKMM
ncbi:hypothetical protein EMIT0324P_11203 [Pseudomonas chlororaphis]